MLLPKRKSAFLLTIAFVAVVNGSKILTKKPAFLTQCPLKDSGFSKCLGKNFESMFSEWKNGVPGLKSIGTLEPLHIKRVTLSHDQSPLAITVDLHNLEVTGISGLRVVETKFDLNKLVQTSTLLIPKFKIVSDYKAKGQLFSLTLNGGGKLSLITEKFLLSLHIQHKLRDEGGFTFIDIEKLRLDIKDAGNMHIHAENLFNGQKDLEDSANALFNDNWRDFYGLLHPAIRSAIETLMNDRLTKVYSYLPATFLIDGLPTAAEYYE